MRVYSPWQNLILLLLTVAWSTAQFTIDDSVTSCGLGLYYDTAMYECRACPENQI